MSYSPMDLDSSLDDLIKKRKTNKTKKPSKEENSKKNKQNTNKPPIQTAKAKVSKPAPRSSSNINSRLSTASKNHSPVFTLKNKPQQQTKQKKTDPSKIIITKDITSNSLLNRIGPSNGTNKSTAKETVTQSRLGDKAQTTSPAGKNAVRGRLGNKATPISMIPSEQRNPLPMRNNFESTPGRGFTIRGISNTSNTSRPSSLRENSGPTTVLVTGLDQLANSEDVRMFLEQFGDILHCEVLKNRAGQSFGEAEVEFSSKSEALNCITMLDNQMADGRFLRIILREPKPSQSFAQKQFRSVFSSISASGRMYADQMPSRYDIHRQ